MEQARIANGARGTSGYSRFLIRAGEVLARSLDLDKTLASVCRLVTETLADICFIDLCETNGIQLVASAHADHLKTRDVHGAGAFLRTGEHRAIHPVHRVAETGEPLLVPDIDDQYIDAAATGAEHAAFMRAMEYRSLIIVPIVSRSERLGALTLVRTAAHPSFDEEALTVCEDLGRRVGMAIANAQAYGQTLSLAVKYQQAALPASLPAIDGYLLDALYEPAGQEPLVGGDWYDLFELPDGRFAISIGDMMGHGFEASLSMLQLRSAIRGSLLVEPDATRALETADRFLRAISPEEPLGTAMISILDAEHRTMTCAPAGHPGPLIWWPNSTVTDPFQSRGLPLGYRDLAPAAPAQTVTLQPGAFAVYFTDGLTEWNRCPEDGERALREAMCRRAVREAAHPAKAIRDAVIRGPHPDDVALLTMRATTP